MVLGKSYKLHQPNTLEYSSTLIGGGGAARQKRGDAVRVKVVRKKWSSFLARAPVADHGVHEALRNPLQKGEASGRPPALLAGSPVTKSDPWCAGASPRATGAHFGTVTGVEGSIWSRIGLELGPPEPPDLECVMPQRSSHVPSWPQWGHSHLPHGIAVALFNVELFNPFGCLGRARRPDAPRPWAPGPIWPHRSPSPGPRWAAGTRPRARAIPRPGPQEPRAASQWLKR